MLLFRVLLSTFDCCEAETRHSTHPAHFLSPTTWSQDTTHKKTSWNTSGTLTV